MKIIIDYTSSWRNSFLDGNNNEPLPPKGRKFIASMTNLKKEENFIQRDITLDTVMGILNRLIGDQRKLYQSRQADDYYFKDLESRISFKDNIDRMRTNENEVTYIRNMTGNEDRESFTGIIKSNDPVFSSDYSPELWGVLALNFNQLCDFIIKKDRVSQSLPLDPISIISKLEQLDKEKPVANENTANAAMQALNQHFPEANYLSNKGEIKPVMFYCSSLYLQLERLKERFNDIDTARTSNGTISGISKRGFTKKDFMNRFTTGKKKKIWGNPYVRKERIKGVGEVMHFMSKASGQLEIEIDVDKKWAERITEQIENAGVSSFYLGKKGLAYVTHIDPQEVKN